MDELWDALALPKSFATAANPPHVCYCLAALVPCFEIKNDFYETRSPGSEKAQPRTKAPFSRQGDAFLDVFSFLGFDSMCCTKTNMAGSPHSEHYGFFLAFIRSSTPSHLTCAPLGQQLLRLHRLCSAVW
jgi:hypothetical protein